MSDLGKFPKMKDYDDWFIGCFVWACMMLLVVVLFIWAFIR
jgi:hypothetical protein